MLSPNKINTFMKNRRRKRGLFEIIQVMIKENCFETTELKLKTALQIHEVPKYKVGEGI